MRRSLNLVLTEARRLAATPTYDPALDALRKALEAYDADMENNAEDDPLCESCDGPVLDDDPYRAVDVEDGVYFCGGCASSMPAGEVAR
jgi:hypothetical protein